MKCFCSKFAGTFDEQVRDMFRCILEFYDVQSVEYRLDHLKPSMIKDPTKKFPKLRAKAGEFGESRCLVLWAAQMADALRDAGNEVEQTMYKCAWHFNKCYEQLSSKTFDATVLAQHGVAFANLYVALHQHFMVQGVCLFKVTKLHLFCEISYRGRDCPSVHWTYRDEDWGGKPAKEEPTPRMPWPMHFLVVSPRGIKFLCFKACLSPLQKKDERSKASCMHMHACMAGAGLQLEYRNSACMLARS